MKAPAGADDSDVRRAGQQGGARQGGEGGEGRGAPAGLPLNSCSLQPDPSPMFAHFARFWHAELVHTHSTRAQHLVMSFYPNSRLTVSDVSNCLSSSQP